MSEREGDSGKRGSLRRRRTAGRSPGVARLVLQTPGRRGLGPGRLGSVRPVARRRIQATRDPESAPALWGSPVLAAASGLHVVALWKQPSLVGETGGGVLYLGLKGAKSLAGEMGWKRERNLCIWVFFSGQW